MTNLWNFSTAGKLVFGCGAVQQLGSLCRQIGAGRVLIVTDPVLVEVGVAETVCEPLIEAGIEFELFDGGEPEPSITAIDRAVEVARGYQPDAIIGLGGGSNLDLAKMTAVVAKHGGGPADYFGFDKVPGPVIPLIGVPTTAGTGSEVSSSSVLTDTENAVKISALSRHLRPVIAVVDPRMTLSCPKQVTADSGIDALTHAVEAYTAVDGEAMQLGPGEANPYSGRTPMTDALCEEAIRLVGQHLVTAVERGDDLPAREGMALAATLAGMAFSNAGVAVVHALEYPIGGAVHCSHGLGNGLLLPYVMRYNLPVREAALARVAELLGESVAGLSTRKAAEVAITAVERLKQQIGIPERLREIGAREDQLATFADKAFAIKRLMQTNPRIPTRDELLGVLREAY